MRKLFALSVALILVIAAASCSSDDSDGSSKETGSDKTTTTKADDSGGESTSTTADEEAADASEAEYLAAFKTALTTGDKAAGQLVLTKAEADCMAQGWLDAITVKTLKAGQASPSDVAEPGFDTTGLDLTEAQAEAMVAAFHDCDVDAAALFVESLTQSLTPEQQACAAENIDGDQVDALLVKGFSGQDSDAEFGAITTTLTKACDLPG